MATTATTEARIPVTRIAHVYPTKIWVEHDMCGTCHVMLQHETCAPIVYCSFHYCYGYTDNASTQAAATKMALSLGAVAPVEHRNRPMRSLTESEIQARIEQLQSLLTANPA